MPRSKRKHRSEDEALVESYKIIFATPTHGHRVLEDLRAIGKANPFSTDPLIMAFNCGKQGMVEMIEKLIAPKE